MVRYGSKKNKFMKTTILKKMLAVSALALGGFLFTSPAFAASYNNYNYDNQTF